MFASLMSLPEFQVEKAVTALLKHWETIKDEPTKGRSELIKDEEFISVIIGLKQIPHKRGFRPRRMYVCMKGETRP